MSVRTDERKEKETQAERAGRGFGHPPTLLGPLLPVSLDSASERSNLQRGCTGQPWQPQRGTPPTCASKSAKRTARLSWAACRAAAAGLLECALLLMGGKTAERSIQLPAETTPKKPVDEVEITLFSSFLFALPLSWSPRPSGRSSTLASATKCWQPSSQKVLFHSDPPARLLLQSLAVIFCFSFL